MEIKYLYENHMGGIFTSEKVLDYEESHCDQCGDLDILIGSYSSVTEFWNLIKDECDIDGSGGWSLQYIYPNMVIEFEEIFKKIGIKIKDLDLDFEGWSSLSKNKIINGITSAIAIEKTKEETNE